MLITKLREKEKDISERINRVKSNQMDGSICRNCHLPLGHTARTCDLDKCSSVFKCGEEKFHCGETNTREIRSQINFHFIQFPDKSDKCSPSPCEKSRDKKHTISSIMATAPESESQENEQLAMVIRESLRNTPQVSTSLNSAQSVFPICHQTQAPILAIHATLFSSC